MDEVKEYLTSEFELINYTVAQSLCYIIDSGNWFWSQVCVSEFKCFFLIKKVGFSVLKVLQVAP